MEIKKIRDFDGGSIGKVGMFYDPEFEVYYIETRRIVSNKKVISYEDYEKSDGEVVDYAIKSFKRELIKFYASEIKKIEEEMRRMNDYS